jgi:hypothetical protein
MRAKNPVWVPVLFTLGYFGCALLAPIHEDWFTAVVRAFLLLAAAASSLLVWVSWGIWFRRKARHPGWLVGIGLLPIAIGGALGLASTYRARHLAAVDARIKTDTRLVRIDDEELLTPRGNPIGVRLRYEIRYPEGSEAVIPHIPPAGMSAVPPPYLLGLAVRDSESRALSATDYAMTVDLVPDFMPRMLRFVGTQATPSSGSADPCFLWPRGSPPRATVLGAGSQPLWIYLSAPVYSARTKHSYDLRRFYEGALKEGAKECP